MPLLNNILTSGQSLDDTEQPIEEQQPVKSPFLQRTLDNSSGLGDQTGINLPTDNESLLRDAALLHTIQANKMKIGAGEYPVGLVPTSADYFPGDQNVQLGYYRGSIVGDVPIFGGGGALFPFAVLEKKRAALQWQRMQAMMPEPDKVDPKFAKFEKAKSMQADLANWTVSQYENIVNYAKKVDPVYGTNLLNVTGSVPNTALTKLQAQVQGVVDEGDGIMEDIQVINANVASGLTTVTPEVQKLISEFQTGYNWNPLDDAGNPVDRIKYWHDLHQKTFATRNITSVINERTNGIIADIAASGNLTVDQVTGMIKQGQMKYISDDVRQGITSAVDEIANNYSSAIYDEKNESGANPTGLKKLPSQIYTRDQIQKWVLGRLGYKQKDWQITVPPSGGTTKEKVSVVADYLKQTYSGLLNNTNRTVKISEGVEATGGNLGSIVTTKNSTVIVPHDGTDKETDALLLAGGSDPSTLGTTAENNIALQRTYVKNNPELRNSIEELQRTLTGGRNVSNTQAAVASQVNTFRKFPPGTHYAEKFDWVKKGYGAFPVSANMKVNSITENEDGSVVFGVNAGAFQDKQGIILPASAIENSTAKGQSNVFTAEATSPLVSTGTEYTFLPGQVLVKNPDAAFPNTFLIQDTDTKQYVKTQPSDPKAKAQNLVISKTNALGWIDGAVNTVATNWGVDTKGNTQQLGDTKSQGLKVTPYLIPATYSVESRQLTPTTVLQNAAAYAKTPDYQPTEEQKNFMKVVKLYYDNAKNKSPETVRAIINNIVGNKWQLRNPESEETNIGNKLEAEAASEPDNAWETMFEILNSK